MKEYIKKDDSVEKKVAENVGEKVGLASPWQEYCSELKALFAMDDEVTVWDIEEDSMGKVLSIEVKNLEKYVALSELIPEEKVFGNVKLRIDIYDVVNEIEDMDKADLLEKAFAGNPIFDKMLRMRDVTGTPHFFAMFEPTVIQFYNDDLLDPNGFKTTLVQDVARDIFGEVCEGVNFCTTREINEGEYKARD